MKLLDYRLLILTLLALSLNREPVHAHHPGSEKTIYIPEKQARLDDYDDPESQFNNHYMAESENFVVYWDKSFGPNPEIFHDVKKRFAPSEFLKEAERFYDYYIDDLKFVDRKTSKVNKHKMIIYMYNDDETSAYGWGGGDVGMMWFRPSRIREYPFCALAHEMAHCFQYLVGADGSWGYASSPTGRNQTFLEYTAQWMLWQVYPDWMTLENYHLKSYMGKTHYALFHETNQYHAPQMMEYWSYRHEPEIIGRIWRDSQKNEDPVAAYKRLTRISQETFNDEVYDAATRFVTWDITRIKELASPYVNTHHTQLNESGEGWYRIDESRCPQNYGYNAIPIEVPAAGKTISLEFAGIAGEDGFRSIETGKAGWRYGFLAVKENGERVYGKVNRGKNGVNRTVKFKVPEETVHLWLVVTGAPTEHWEHLNDEKDDNDEQWPYRFRLKGTAPCESTLIGDNKSA